MLSSPSALSPMALSDSMLTADAEAPTAAAATTNSSSLAQQTPRTATFPEVSLFVQTAKDLSSLGFNAPSPSSRSDGNNGNSPPHMLMAVTPGSAFGPMVDHSSNFLQGFHCCGRNFDDLFQLLGHQASGNCAAEKAAAAAGPLAAAQARVEASYGGMLSTMPTGTETSHSMLSPMAYLTSDAATLKGESQSFPNVDLGPGAIAVPRLDQPTTVSVPIPAPVAASAPAQQFQQALQIPQQQPQQHIAFIATPQQQPAQGHAPMLLATLPDGRTVLVPIGPGGQIPTVAGDLPSHSGTSPNPGFATAPSPALSSTIAPNLLGASMEQVQQQREALQQEQAAKITEVARARQRTISGTSETSSMNSILQQQILSQQREFIGTPPVGQRSRKSSLGTSESLLTVPGARRDTSPAAASITPGSPASDLSGGVSPGLFSSSYQEEFAASLNNTTASGRTSTKMTPFLAGLDLNGNHQSKQDQVFTVPTEPNFDFTAAHYGAALGITGIQGLPNTTSAVQAYFVHDNVAPFFAVPFPQQVNSKATGIDPSKLFGGASVGMVDLGNVVDPMYAVAAAVPAVNPVVASTAVSGSVESSPSLRGAKRKSTAPSVASDLENGVQRFLLREKEHVSSSPTSSPVLGPVRRDSSRGTGSASSSVPSSPTIDGTPKKKKPNGVNGKPEEPAVTAVRKTSARGFSGALNLFSLNTGPPERVQSLTNDPRPAPLVPPPKHRGSLPILSSHEPAMLVGGFDLGLPALPTSVVPNNKPMANEPVNRHPVGEHAANGEGKVRRKRPKKRYICQIDNCGKEYKNLGGLKYHKVHFHKIPLIRRSEMSEHDKPYQCPVADCPRGFGSAGGLKYHLGHGHPPEIADAAVKAAAHNPKPASGRSGSGNGQRPSRRLLAEELDEIEAVEEEEEDDDGEEDDLDEYSVEDD